MVFVVTSEPYLYHGESLELMTHRWTKLEKVGAMDDTVGWRYVFLGKHPEMEVTELLQTKFCEGSEKLVCIC